jgi:hypothetical protein
MRDRGWSRDGLPARGSGGGGGGLGGGGSGGRPNRLSQATRGLQRLGAKTEYLYVSQDHGAWRRWRGRRAIAYRGKT